MPNELERRSLQRLVEQANELGVGDQVPAVIHEFLAGNGPSCGGALGWVRLHPADQEVRGCCWGEVVKGPEHCICWVPEYDVEQAAPVLPAEPGEIQVRPGGMCTPDEGGRDGGCAYRPGSPEMQGVEAELLRELPLDGDVFFCHEGMRRPARWRHPDGRVIDGSPSDYHALFVRGLPFRANGRVGYICAGWAAWSRRWSNQEINETEASDRA